jgi:uncharacterized protein (DUF952 family)
MSIIYHLIPRAAWDSLPPVAYRADSLDTEGFIHCATAAQVEWAANRFYRDASDLVVLHIDIGKLGSEVKWEEGGAGELFPHIYGPIEREAVVAVTPLERESGEWRFRGA